MALSLFGSVEKADICVTLPPFVEEYENVNRSCATRQ